MSLTVAVQMDPIETIAIKGDSTFALMLEAQARGHELLEFQPRHLSYEDGRVYAAARPVSVQRVEGDHATVGERKRIDLGRDSDVVLMRQDPPFDIGYITATYLLERAARETLVLNNPAAVRDAPEKLFVLDFADFMPPTLITRSLDEVRAFHDKHGDIVLKPLHGKAGEGVFRVREDGANLASLAELFGTIWKEPFIAQAFLPAVSEGDKRIILVDGEVAGAINRIPAKGEIRSNLAAGGRAEKVSLTAREQDICASLGPILRERGLLFVGIDVIGGMLTEINVTSPTGIVALDQFEGSNTAGMIWDAIEAKLSA
ncbi:glutathione synthase [Sphingomicrobium nitratireducens]|uniref:glutathione synthase n=1 Tax=Sphingomicrobium nitratireducens TaxID=2964666 RepID=UPI00224074B1|nr:glutathione synthase [Sphingomicrobium nitratireducens]